MLAVLVREPRGVGPLVEERLAAELGVDPLPDASRLRDLAPLERALRRWDDRRLHWCLGRGRNLFGHGARARPRAWSAAARVWNAGVAGATKKRREEEPKLATISPGTR